MNKDLIKKIAYLSGTIVIFVAGMVYNLCADLVLKTESTWLFGSILLAFGSGICDIFSDKFKENHKVYFTLKGFAVGLALGFIVFLIMYQVLAVPSFESRRLKAYGTIINVVSIVVSVLSLGALVADLALSALSVKADEE